MKLALGTAQFGMDYGAVNESGRVPLDEVARILRMARGCGLDMLDTAIAYGESESTLGKAGVADWRVVTKLPGVPAGCADVAEWVISEVRGSLSRMRILRAYGLLMHRPADLLGHAGDELLRGLQTAVDMGLVQKIGASIYSADDLPPLMKRAKLGIVQAPLNVLDRRLVETGWAARLKDSGVELHTRSAFLQGTLLVPTSRLPVGFRRWADVWARWGDWLAASGLTALQGCLAYLNSVDQIDRIVVGVDSSAQLRAIIDACATPPHSVPQLSPSVDQTVINPAAWGAL